MISLDITLLRGLPVTADVYFAKADPSVGIWHDYIDEVIYRSQRTGKLLGDWVQRRIDETPGEQERVDAAIWQAYEAIYEGGL